MTDRHIDISLELNSRQLDLRVPTAVTLARLTELIGQVFREHHVTMPETWSLELRSKPITIGDFDILDEFPLGDGDVFAVVCSADRVS